MMIIRERRFVTMQGRKTYLGFPRSKALITKYVFISARSCCPIRKDKNEREMVEGTVGCLLSGQGSSAFPRILDGHCMYPGG